MIRIQRYFFLPAALILIAVLTAGCQKSKNTCPFTDISWGDTLEDITELEGDSSESYDSIYDGTTYTFPKEYIGLKGTIKYTFDDKDRLVGISWMYECSDSEDLRAVYDKIHAEAYESLGESGYKLNSDKFAEMASPSDVWYLKSGNVILNTVDSSELKALQYTYLHPDVSEDRPEDSTKG